MAPKQDENQPHATRTEDVAETHGQLATPVHSLSQKTASLVPPPQSGELTEQPTGEYIPQALVSGPSESGSFGRYQLVERIAQGAMGAIYRAFDPQLNRDVALKTILSGSSAQCEEVERFYREAEAIAQLKHRHIVSIYDIGDHDGEHYFTMEFAEGGTLSAARRDFRDRPKAAAAFMEKVARGVHHAHQHDIVHRDLKPNNILISEDGEPLVGDFGLAKILGGTDLTRSGAKLGTPSYMAPEQAAGLTEKISPKSDIWALGVILYELFTGLRPFPGDSDQEVSRRICYHEPVRPGRLRTGITRELETIVLKCLEKDPIDRYETALELADDLARWQKGKPIHARPRPAWLQLWRKLRRNWIAAVTITLFVALSALVVLLALPKSTPVENIARELQFGREVELVGERGLPRHWEFAFGGMGVIALKQPEEMGAFRVEVRRHSSMELVSDPQHDRYNYAAEFRQERTKDNGMIGIYFMHHTATTKQDYEHCFGELIFSDVGTHAGRLMLNVRRLRRKSGKNPVAHYDNYKIRGLSYRFDPKPETWRKLRVRVEGDNVSAYFDGKKLGTVSMADVTGRATRLVKNVKGEEWPAPDPTFPRLDSRGALGIFGFQTSASVRFVRIAPLRP